MRAALRFSSLLIAGLTIAGLAGCGGMGGDVGAGGGSGNDTVVLNGSSTVYRISRAAQLGFMKSEGDAVKVVVGNTGTGGGFSRYLQGELDIVDASRPASAEEESKAKEQGYEWTRFIVGYDGITVVVNPANDFVKSLSVEQLKKLLEPDSKVNTWKELDPSWPDRKISLYTPDNDSGTYEYFTEAVIGKKNQQRKDVQASSDDNTLVTGVSGDEDGLGYFGYAYYAANKAKLRAVPIQKDAASEPVLPSPASILDQTYQPLARPLFIYVKNTSMERPGVAKFVNYYINNLDTLATQAMFVPPTADDQAENLKSLEPRPAAP